MPALRYHYSDTIEDFLTRPSSEIIGELTLANVHDVNNGNDAKSGAFCIITF